MLDIDYEKQVEEQTKFEGKGRGSKNRAKKVIKKVRFSINSVTRNFDIIDEAKERFGWKAFVTSQSFDTLSLSEAVINIQNEYRISLLFNRLKSHLNIALGEVKRNDQIIGLTNLLSLSVQVLTVIEYVGQSSLHRDNATLPDLQKDKSPKRNWNENS